MARPRKVASIAAEKTGNHKLQSEVPRLPARRRVRVAAEVNVIQAPWAGIATGRVPDHQLNSDIGSPVQSTAMD